MIQDPNIHQVLSIEPIYMKAETEDIKLAIGYYGNVIQTIDFTRGSDGDAYIMVVNSQTPLGFVDKPGVGALSSLVLESKGLIVSGGFDHRVRMISARTLKSLLTLNFH